MSTGGLFATEAGSGPHTVVLIHGFAGSHHVWRDVQESLAADVRTIAYDIPGHGNSLDWPEAGPPKVAVKAILADLGERNGQPVHLVGHSMGGAIATLVAIAEPGRVASLTLLAPGGFGPEINQALLRRYAAARTDTAIRDCLAEMMAPGITVSDAVVASAVAMRAKPGQTEKLGQIVEIIARDGRQGTIPADRLEQLSMPVAVAWGTLDPVLPFRQAESMPLFFAMHRLEGKGHMLIEEALEVVAGLIRQAAC